MLRIALCAALLVPVFGPSQPKPERKVVDQPTANLVKHLALDDLVVNEVCPLLQMDELGSGICIYLFEDCVAGFWYMTEVTCDTPERACDCDEPVATVALPDVDGRRSRGMASAGPAFKGQRVATDAFLGSPLPKLRTSDAFVVSHDEAVNVDGRAFRIRSLIHKETQSRFDFGCELVGVGTETLARYRRGQLRTVFGNDMQANIQIGGETRLFHLIGIGESAVPASETDSPIIPVPDTTVPPRTSTPGLN